MDSLNAIKQRMRRDMLAAFVLLGGLGLLGVFLMASSVVRRVRNLASAAARVSKGEMDVTVEPSGGDELAGLTRDFNAMTASLREQRKALDDAAATLADREALAAIGRATAVIAHEMRNPLGILLGAAQVAANPSRTEQARQQAARMMEEEVRRLERTLGELLTYARPRPPEKVALQALEQCRHAAQRACAPGSTAQDLRVEVAGEDVRVLVDEQHLAQVLLNLLINASQAGATQVVMRTERIGKRALIHVVDNGPGVKAEIREQLFRPFVTTKQRGAGLGLSGSRRMMRDNGGDVVLRESESGAHLVVELPGVEET
jgi:signal transduction histidine kinase